MNTPSQSGTERKTPESGLVEVKLGIFQIKGFNFPGIIYGFSGAARGNFSYRYSMGNEEEVNKARGQFAADLGLNPDRVVQMSLKQGDGVAVVSKDDGQKITSHDDLSMVPDTDAMITKEKGVALLVLTADCLPILFFDPVQKVIGLAHVGRTGAAKDLPVKVVNRMAAEFGSKMSDIVAGIGPAIGPECYVFNQVPAEQQAPEWLDYVRRYPEGSGLDFVGYATDSLKRLGVQVCQSNWCVRHEKGFFSHVGSIKDQVPEKRFATTIERV